MKKYEIKIENDENAWNPREDDNVTTMICFHKRYNMGDQHNVNGDDYSGWDEMEEAIKAEHEVLIMKPLYMMEHGNISVSTSPFGCGWDSGRLGIVFIARENLNYFGITDLTDDKLERILEGEVKEYDQYLRGEVYQYSVSEVETCDLGCDHVRLISSCGGYYDEKDCRDEAEAVVALYKKGIALDVHSV